MDYEVLKKDVLTFVITSVNEHNLEELCDIDLNNKVTYVVNEDGHFILQNKEQLQMRGDLKKVMVILYLRQ